METLGVNRNRWFYTEINRATKCNLGGLVGTAEMQVILYLWDFLGV
jgi:hypothetical protein